MIRSSEVEAPQFPVALSAISIDRLLEAYRDAPARLARALDGVGEDDLRTRAIPGKWAIQEIALHVADSELVGAVRVRKVLAEKRPDLPGYNQELFATGLDYLGRDAAFRRAALHGFRNLRETTGALFESAAPGTGSGRGSTRSSGRSPFDSFSRCVPTMASGTSARSSSFGGGSASPPT